MAAYYSLMVESATILGANRQEAEQQLLEVLNFETTLANVSANLVVGGRRAICARHLPAHPAQGLSPN